MLAAKEGHTTTVKVLIEAGSDLSVGNKVRSDNLSIAHTIDLMCRRLSLEIEGLSI